MSGRRISTGRIVGVTLGVAVILVGLATATGHIDWKFMPGPPTLPEESWDTVLEWDFTDGLHPRGWGWGEWRLVDEGLEITSGPGEIAVYFTPARHERDFVMEATVRLVSSHGEKGVRAHLLTRDSNRLTHESGVVLEDCPGKVAVRHMVNRHNYVSDLVPSPVANGDRDWHDLKLVVRDGFVSAWVDDELVYEADEPVPPGFYTEPHLCAENGTARFRNIRIRSTSGT